MSASLGNIVGGFAIATLLNYGQVRIGLPGRAALGIRSRSRAPYSAAMAVK